MIVALILVVWLIGVPVAVLAAGALCHWRNGRRAPVLLESVSSSNLVPDPGRVRRSGRTCEVRRRAMPVAIRSAQP